MDVTNIQFHSADSRLNCSATSFQLLCPTERNSSSECSRDQYQPGSKTCDAYCTQALTGHTPSQAPSLLESVPAEAWRGFHHNVCHPTNTDSARDTAFSFRPHTSLAVYSASFETFAGYSIFRQDCQYMVVTRLSATEHNHWWTQTQRPNSRVERLWEARKCASRRCRG
jgi:hypothetical protein